MPKQLGRQTIKQTDPKSPLPGGDLLVPENARGLLSIGKAASFLKVSIDTMRNWEAQGTLLSLRTPGGTRKYRLSQLKRFAQNHPKLSKKLEIQTETKGKERVVLEREIKKEVSDYQPQQLPTSDFVAPHLAYAKSPIEQAIKPFSLEQHLQNLIPVIEVRSQTVSSNTNNGEFSLFSIIKTSLITFSTATVAITGLMVAGYLTDSSLNKTFASIQPFNSLAKSYISLVLPQKAAELGFNSSSKIASSSQVSQPIIAASADVLAATTRPGTLTINANAAISGTLTIAGDIVVTGTNIQGLVRTITAGDNITVSDADPSNPTISVSLPTNLVNSFATSTTGTKVSGDIILGSGLSLATDTKTITVSTPTLSSVRSAGGCSGCIKDDDVESALTISSSGSVAVGALSSAVTIAKGGTGLTSYTTGDILYANSSGELAKLAVGTSGQSLVVASGLPSWSSSGAGVTSLNSLTGELTIAGTSNQITVAASSTTVTLSLPSTVTTTTLNASSALQLNGTSINTGGTLTNVAYLDTAQTFSAAQTNSTAGAASTPAEKLTGAWYTGGSGTTTKPHLLIEPTGTTSNAWSTAGTGIGVNAGSTFAGNLIDLQQAAKSIFSVTSVSSAINGFNFLASATGSGVAIAADGSGSDTNIALAINGKGSGKVQIGATSTGDVELAGGSAATGCTISNSTGALTCAGDITGGSTGTLGYWTRTGSSLAPATSGDAITTSGAISTSGSGTLSIAGAATFSSTINTNTFSSTALTFASGATTAVISAATTGTSVEIDSGGGTGSILFGGGSGSTGCTVADSTGDLTCAGSITGGSTSNQGFWARSVTTLSPVTTGDSVTTSGNISTSGSGTITSAGLLTGQAGLTITGGTVSLNASSNNNTNINTGTSSGAISIGNASAGAIALSSSSTLGITTTTSAQTHTSAVISGNTTSSAFVFTDSALTTGTGLYLVSSSLTSGKLAHIAPTFAGAGVTGYGVYLGGADSTASGNTDYQLYSTLALSDNAAKTGVGIYSTVTSSSTTGDTLIALDLATSATGALSATQTRAIYGVRSQPASTGASNNADDTLNLYGSYQAPTSTLALAGTTNVYGEYISTTATHAADAGTINQYGLYIANGTSSTNGTATKYGIYVAAPTGADTNYALYIAGGNATLADGSLLDLSAINLSSTTEGLLLPQNATACSSATAEGQICWDTSTDTLYIGKSGSTAAYGQGDITAVGSMTSGAAFADSGADDDWLGLGSGAGRIEFDDQTTDEVNILSANVGIGTQTPGGSLDVSAAKSLTPSLTGAYLSFSASTLTDSGTAASGTLANAAFNSIAAPTLAATNTSVVTDHAYTLYLAGPPTAGTNETINNSYALGVNGKTQLANATELSGSTDATTTIGTRSESRWSVTNLSAGTNTYNYRRTITVTNNDSTTALPTNYELTITLTTGAGSQSADVCATSKNDSSDIIVATASGPTEIARNVTRTSCTAGSQEILIKFQNQASIAASGTATYYLYYGNSGSSNSAPTTYSTAAVALDSADNVGSWTTSDATNFALSQETTIKQEGTGSIKAIAAAVACTGCGNVGSFSTTNQGQLPTTRAYYNATESVVIGGTGYLYFIGGEFGPILSTVYKSTISSSGDLGSFVTTSQGQLLVTNSYFASDIVDVGGTNYIYIIGGYNPTVSSVYKAQISSTGNIGSFSTTNQGQMLEAIWQNASTVASVGGTSYIYVLGDADGNTSAVYKGMINPANGDVGSFATTSQGQLKVATVFGAATTVTIGGTNYVYIVGGNTISTVYKAQIDTSANIGSFVSTSQGQLPVAMYTPAVNPLTVAGTNYLYVSGGDASAVYRAIVDSSGNVGSFVTTSQAQFPAAIREFSNIVTLGTSSYFYGLGNSGASVVYKAKIVTPDDPNYAATLTTSAKDLTNKGGIQLQVYSSRTGTYLTYDVSEDGVTWIPSSNSITVSSANTWETKQLDISETANSGKDAITRVRIKATDATTGFTMYFDDMSGITTAFTGSSPSVAQATRVIGAANMTLNSQGTGVIRLNYDSATLPIAGSGGLAIYNGATTAYFQIDANGNAVVGQGAALATTATNGFLYLPSSAGLPTGVPTSYTGSLAMEYDSSNNKLCVYNAAWKCSGALSDFAEWAPARGTESGDIVVTTNETNPIDDPTSPFMLGKSTAPYDQKIVGVISKYAEDANDAHGYKRSDDYHAVALTGRVPVKIASNSAAIKRGDYLTSSSIPGQAMKATKPGQIVGKALEDFDPLIANQSVNPGMVLAFIQPGFADPTNALANLTIDEDGNLLVPNLKVTNLSLDSGIKSTDLSSNLSLNQTESSSSAALNMASTLITLDQIQATQAAQLANVNLRVKDLETKDYDGKIASLSAQISSLSAQLAKNQKQQKQEEILAKLTELTAKLSESATPSAVAGIASASSQLADDLRLRLTAPESLLATGSAQLATLSVGSEATFSGRLIAYESIVSNVFKSLGDTFLGKTTVAEELNIDGMLYLKAGSVEAIGTLYLQSSPLSTSLDIFNGKVVVDKDGNLTTSGDIKANNLEIAGALITRVAAGEDLIVGDAVYITDTGTVKRASSRDDSSVLVVGIAAESANKDAQIKIAINGKVGGFKNLQVGKQYFLGYNGKLVTVPSSLMGSPGSPQANSSEKAIQIGIAFSETSMLVQIHPDAILNSKVLGIQASAEVDESINIKPKDTLKELINSLQETLPSPSPTSSKSLTVNDNAVGFLRVRSESKVSSTELTKLNIGDSFPILEEQNGWFEIEYLPNQTGWVLGSYVSVTN